MSQAYIKQCNRCKEKIKMSDISGSWKAYSTLDNSKVHQCKKQQTNGHTNSNEDLSLEIVLKKLKTIGITLDLTVLKNAVNGDTVNGDKKKTHCESCGEWLEGFGMCSECGMINK